MKETEPHRFSEAQWLIWARELHSLAQAGRLYADNPFDLERYDDLRRVAAEIFSAYGGIDTREVLDLFDKDVGYATPKIDVRGVVFREDKIMMVREIQDDGRWTLPGGWADVNESPSSGVCREVFEESGYEVRAVKLLGVFDRSRHIEHNPLPFTIYKLFFQCEIIGGAPGQSHETGGVAFWGEEEIHDLSVARTAPTQLSLMFQHLRDPQRPADFD